MRGALAALSRPDAGDCFAVSVCVPRPSDTVALHVPEELTVTVLIAFDPS